ncbi:MAG: hypothetical protein HN403_13265 [Rhodospirillales bacterium]|nr:hypothetical protein [Rhodospirillales bacterium]
MGKSATALGAALFVGALVLSGCTQKVGVSPPPSANDAGQTVTGFTTFPDLPMVSGGEIDVDKTLIFGAGETWFGRLVINSGNDSGQIFDFYRGSLPGFGWREITSVRAAASVLTYSREQRIATIQIQGRTLRGSEISITVSPREVPQDPAAAGAPLAPVQAVQ